LFTSHYLTPAVIEFLSTVHVRVVAFARQPLRTQFLQILDLTLFSILKRRAQYQLPLDDDAGTARFIKKMYHDHDFLMTMTMIERNIWGAF
jgi:hypothetical protein